jgi:hypothetical protein
LFNLFVINCQIAKLLAKLVSTAASDTDESYTLHPTTLDSIFVACFACTPEATSHNNFMTPRSIRTMFVPKNFERHTSSKMRWQMDVLHDFPAALKDSLRIHLDDAEVDFENRMIEASYYIISDCVAQLEPQNMENLQSHHKRFYKLMKSVVEKGDSGELGPDSHNWSKASNDVKERPINSLTAENAASELTCRVGRNLDNIVRGDVAPLELMMEDSLLNRYYQELARWKSRTHKQLRKVVELYAPKELGAIVLEIGGSTKAAVKSILISSIRERQ